MPNNNRFPHRAPSPINLHMTPSEFESPQVARVVTTPNSSPVEAPVANMPSPVKTSSSGGEPIALARSALQSPREQSQSATIPQVSASEVTKPVRGGFWIPMSNKTLGLQLESKCFKPSHALIEGDYDRKATTNRLDSQSFNANWQQSQGVVELAARPDLGLTLPGIPGIKVGFAAESLLQYRSLRPYPRPKAFAEGQGPVAPNVELPTTSAAAVKMARGSEVELTGRGTIKGSLGAGVGSAVSAGPVSAGVGINAGVTQSFTGELQLRVKKLEKDCVRVDIADIDSVATNLTAQVTAGLSVENTTRNIGEGLIITAVRNGANEDLMKLVNIIKNSNLKSKISYERGTQTRDLDAIVLDLSKPEAKKAYDQLMSLDATLAEQLAELPDSGVWQASAYDVQHSEEFEASVSALGSKLLLFKALETARSGSYEAADGKKVIYHDASYEQKSGSALTGSRSIVWQGVSVSAPSDTTSTDPYFRMTFSDTDKVCEQEEVDSLFRFAQALNLDTRGADWQLEPRSFLQRLLGDGDDTQVDLDIYFTPDGIKSIDTASRTNAIVAAIIALQKLDPKYAGIPFGDAELGAYATKHVMDYLSTQPSSNSWDYFTPAYESWMAARDYRAKTNRDISVDAQALLKAIEMADLIQELDAGDGSKSLASFFATLGQAQGFDYPLAITTLANLAGEEDTLIHRFELAGKEVGFKANDEGQMQEVTPQALMRTVRSQRSA